MSNYKIKLLSKTNTKTLDEINSLLFQLDPTILSISIEILRKIINSTTTFVFIATNTADEIIGMITLVSFPKLEGLNKTWIEDLVVDESY